MQAGAGAEPASGNGSEGQNPNRRRHSFRASKTQSPYLFHLAKDYTMKKFAIFAALLSLMSFNVGCTKTEADKKADAAKTKAQQEANVDKAKADAQAKVKNAADDAAEDVAKAREKAAEKKADADEKASQ
jgi:hypothetical protein